MEEDLCFLARPDIILLLGSLGVGEGEWRRTGRKVGYMCAFVHAVYVPLHLYTYVCILFLVRGKGPDCHNVLGKFEIHLFLCISEYS